MTAEVAILNREAVALAADSAVTLTGPRGSKIYNTADKLFPLFPLWAGEPVAVMFYGNVSFGTIPWPTIIKEYYRERGSQKFDTLDDYASDFFAYLLSVCKHLSDEARQQQVEDKVEWELDRLCHVVKNHPQNATSTGSTSNTQGILTRSIKDRIDELSRNSIQDLDQEKAEDIIDSMVDWPTMLDQSLGEFQITTEIAKLVKVMANVSLCAISNSPLQSGIIVAGFGAKQCFPALYHRLIDGIIEKTVLTRLVENAQIGDNPLGDTPPSIIRGYAQDDMVTSFLSGLHPKFHVRFEVHKSDIERVYTSAINNLVNHLRDQFQLPLSEKDVINLETKMLQIWSDSIKAIEDPIDSFTTDHYFQIVPIVQWLPKEELAEMAETLVNLTSFKRRVTPENETVGGPVDVAVVTKGEGFTWVTRKHS